MPDKEQKPTMPPSHGVMRQEPSPWKEVLEHNKKKEEERRAAKAKLKDTMDHAAPEPTRRPMPSSFMPTPHQRQRGSHGRS